MRSINKLLSQIRRQTENEEYDLDNLGISDDEIIQYINDAQYNLQALVVNKHPRAFINEVIIPVDGSESYALPTDCFLGNKVHNVEYSPSGSSEDYYPLEQETIKSRVSGVDGSPTKYIRMSGKILLTPQPTTGGSLRVNYVQRLKELDKRQAKITQSATVSSSGTFDIVTDEVLSYVKGLQNEEYICIVDKKGHSIVKNIEIDSLNNFTITCKAHTLAEGEPINIPAGSFIVGGLDTTTHSGLDISVERYLISYAAFKILKRDSSVDSAEAAQELSAMIQEIVSSYSLITDDVEFIPQLNSWEDWSV